MKILVEGLDDWVSVDSLIWEAKEAAGQSDFRSVFVEVLAAMFAREYVEAGRVGGPDGFVSEGASRETLDRVVAECESLDWRPRGGGYWLANTERGTRHAREDGGERS